MPATKPPVDDDSDGDGSSDGEQLDWANIDEDIARYGKVAPLSILLFSQRRGRSHPGAGGATSAAQSSGQKKCSPTPQDSKSFFHVPTNLQQKLWIWTARAAVVCGWRRRHRLALTSSNLSPSCMLTGACSSSVVLLILLECPDFMPWKCRATQRM